MDKWKPINFRGAWNYDPRGEVLARARYAEEAHDSYVSIPIKLAIALGNLRECTSTFIITSDEDGPCVPQILYCRKPEGHDHDHFNEYCSWKPEQGLVPQVGIIGE